MFRERDRIISDKELRITDWLGIPSVLLTVFFALIYGYDSWVVYIGILILGWFIYTLLYWQLYKRFMLNRFYEKSFTFYSLLVLYQIVLCTVIFTVFLSYNIISES